MCRALIIGAGGVGTVVTQKIAANPVFSDVMLASRTKSKCDAVAAAIGGNRVKTAQVDADNVPELCELFRAFKPDIVVNVALPYQDLTIMDACLECGCNYLDTANYEPKDEAISNIRGSGPTRIVSRPPGSRRSSAAVSTRA